ncbi:MAG: aspartate dehydrogenase [Candidatus Omnitrophota bacterium]|nr:aspartate dehydrogenase [Candidatus Omnitrophota bacterium]
MRIKRKNILKIGIVGCGAIGSRIAKAITKDFSSYAKLVALCDIDKNKAEKLKNKLKDKKIGICSLDRLIRLSDLVVESASVGISAQLAEKVISQGKDILVMSTGGLLEREDLLQKARKKNASIYFPSGGICGLDGLKAAAISKIKKITLTTRKPVKSLPDYFSNIKKETLIFKGNACEAVRKFPQNINVAATLSLAGLGAKRTFVRIIASPGIDRNIHEVEIESEAGRIFTRTENVPSPDNPKTSYLASLSAIATLKQIFDAVKIGT